MGSLQIAFLDVGQGDTIIIHDPDTKEAVVVDCVKFISVLEFFKAEGITRLRALVLTHFHADHYLGAVALLNNCAEYGVSWEACVFRWDKDFRKAPELLVDSDNHSDMVSGKNRRLSNYQAFTKWARQSTNKKRLLEHQQLPKDSRLLKALNFLHPQHPDVQELFEIGSLNNLSYVIQVKDGVSALLTGDIEPAGWEFVRQNHPTLLNNAVLKFPHHGAWRGGDVGQLIADVKPQFIVISVGTGNSYGHPSPELFAALKKHRNSHLFCTQATSQCVGQPNTVRNQILATLKSESLPQYDSQSGCLCAGTILIELGPTVKVLAPTAELHNRIIKTYMDTPQCVS